MPRRNVPPPVPPHLEDYLSRHEGCWGVFDARYLTRPDMMPLDYAANDLPPGQIARLACARLSAHNVRAALYVFVPYAQRDALEAIVGGLSQHDCRRMAQQVVMNINERPKPGLSQAQLEELLEIATGTGVGPQKT